MDSDRLERSTQSLHGMAMSLATVVVGAISMDKASADIDLGDAARWMLMASLVCFGLTALAGGHLITRLPLLDGSLDEVMAQKVPLVGTGDQGFLRLSIGRWRAVQHWGLLVAVVLGAAGGLATATAEDLAKAKPVQPPAAAIAATSAVSPGAR